MDLLSGKTYHGVAHSDISYAESHPEALQVRTGRHTGQTNAHDVLIGRDGGPSQQDVAVARHFAAARHSDAVARGARVRLALIAAREGLARRHHLFIDVPHQLVYSNENTVLMPNLQLKFFPLIGLYFFSLISLLFSNFSKKNFPVFLPPFLPFLILSNLNFFFFKWSHLHTNTQKKTDFERAVSWLIDWVHLTCHGINKLIGWLNDLEPYVWSIDRLLDCLISVINKNQ